MKQFSDAELLELLKGVSRSFVLTIRALPRGLRRPVGLAYLLARASDTIADTASAAVSVRIECLSIFVETLLRTRTDLFAKLTGILPANPSEQYLLANLERVIDALWRLPESDREEIVTLLRKITHGQELDLSRFQNPNELRALQSAAELDEYTYLVAGCVGEFWTRICSAHLPAYGRLDLDQLCRLGRAFGQGLQLVNILRDIPEDLRNGRCYLPMSDLREVGIPTLDDLRNSDLRRAQPVFEQWRQKALDYHDEARLYIESIRPWRIRFACLLPWALGLRTLELLSEQSPLEHTERVKVTRKEVTRIMRRAIRAAISNRALRAWAEERNPRSAGAP
jgi:farnesyl-diphosphate farnesyltransferase